LIRHLAGFAEILEDVDEAAAFYRSLGLEVLVENGYGRVEVPGVLHFGLWGRRDAAQATFGSPDAIDRVPLGFSIGFEVDSVDGSLDALGATVLNEPKDEPWGQRTLRFRTPSGSIAEVSETPWARALETNVAGKSSEAAAT
jgi:catechol 2,3-dioxygenase-like lactoylglutathione lyase family enzyme